MVNHTPAGALADGPVSTTGPRGYASVPVPVGVAQRALHLEALLGDPRDTANPYGAAALAAAAQNGTAGGRPPAPDGLGGASDAWPDPAQFVWGLRPLLRRDLGLADAWVLRSLREVPAPALAAPPPPPGSALPSLLGSAALLAATGGVLHTTAAIVADRAPHDPAVRQWLPVLAAVFTDLLACESLTTVALRGLDPADDAGSLPVAAAGYLVPHLVSGLLADLELVLHENGFAPETTELRSLAAIEEHRAAAGADWRAASDAQRRLARAWSLPDRPPGPTAQAGQPGEMEQAGQPGEPEQVELFRLARPAPQYGAARCAEALLAVLPGVGTATGPRAAGVGGEDPLDTELVRVVRRLATEQRGAGRARRAAHSAGPDSAQARALADRLALVLQAGAVLGVARGAAQSGEGFLGRPAWALLALRRIGRRLGLPLPAGADAPGDASTAVWHELAERVEQGVDCDLYATRLLW